MLKKIILVLTEEYKNTIQESGEFLSFTEELKKYAEEVELYSVREVNRAVEVTFKAYGNNAGKQEALFFSDDAITLSKLQERGCYTLAVYHEGVSGLLSGTQFATDGVKDPDWEYFNKVYQRFCGEPWSITETARCSIREMAVTDVDELYELYSGPNVTRYMEGLFADREKEVQYIEDYIENIYKYYGFGTWLIHRKEDGKLIGRAGFSYRPGYDEAELGFVISEPFWRQGYAYEVCSHLMKLASDVYELERVQALVKKENTASVGLLEKLGFVQKSMVDVDGESYLRYMAELAY